MGLDIIDESKEPWYQNGLHFGCTQCGQCCTGFPGYAWVTVDEMFDIANYLKVTIEEFCKKYVRLVDAKWALLDHPVTFACIFLNGNKCSIYPVRPSQCRQFPWWPQNLASEEAWQKAASRCEGIRPDAPLIPLETIQRRMRGEEDEGQS